MCSTVLSRSDYAYVQRQYGIDPGGEGQQQMSVLLPALRDDIASLAAALNDNDIVDRSITNTGKKQRRGIYLSCCVRASPEKEPHTFVEVVEVLHRRGVFQDLDITPLVAGAGWGVGVGVAKPGSPSSAPLSTVEQYALSCRKRLQESVPYCRIIDTFLGPKDMASIYAQTALNFHPPSYDAFGMTIVEAASQGAPSLAADRGHVGATDLLSPDRQEIFVHSFSDTDSGNSDSDRIEKITDTVEALLRSRTMLEEVGQKAKRAALRWTERANAQTLLERIQHSLSRSSAYSTPTPTLIPTIDVISSNALSVEEFTERYLDANTPVIITNVGTTWRASTEWVHDNNDNSGRSSTPAPTIDIDAFKRKFGEHKVTVTDTAKCHRGQGPCQEMTIGDFWAWFTTGRSARSNVRDGPWWYVKDWHILSLQTQGDSANETNYYSCPEYFKDDWLNEWYDSLSLSSSNNASDYRFLYLGPKGSSTPLHADVLRSHSWSVNIAGRKRWRLLAPSHTAHILHAINGIDHPPDFYPYPPLEDEQPHQEEQGMYKNVSSPYPSREQAQQHIIEVIQYPGEAIFVPSNWFHTVENIDDCCSINHNWISSESLVNAWEHLKKERQRAAELIEDCRGLCVGEVGDFEGLVQKNVAASAGMSWEQFGRLVMHGCAHAPAVWKEKRMCVGRRVLEDMLRAWKEVEQEEKEKQLTKGVKTAPICSESIFQKEITTIETFLQQTATAL